MLSRTLATASGSVMDGFLACGCRLAQRTTAAVMVGFYGCACSHLRYVIHESIIGFRRTGTGYLVVAAFHLRKSRNGPCTTRALPAAAAILVPVHCDLVCGDEAVPIG